MRSILVAVLLVLAGSAGTAHADAPGPGFGPEPGPGLGYRPVRRHAYRARHVHRRYRAVRHGWADPAYPAAAFGAVVGPSEYREAYIGRGLIYNTPPDLGGEVTLSVRY